MAQCTTKDLFAHADIDAYTLSEDFTQDEIRINIQTVLDGFNPPKNPFTGERLYTNEDIYCGSMPKNLCNPALIIEFVDKYLVDPINRICDMMPCVDTIKAIVEGLPKSAVNIYNSINNLNEIFRYSTDFMLDVSLAQPPCKRTILYQRSPFSLMCYADPGINNTVIGQKYIQEFFYLLYSYINIRHGRLVFPNKYIEAYVNYVVDLSSIIDGFWDELDEKPYDSDVMDKISECNRYIKKCQGNNIRTSCLPCERLPTISHLEPYQSDDQKQDILEISLDQPQ